MTSPSVKGVATPLANCERGNVTTRTITRRRFSSFARCLEVLFLGVACAARAVLLLLLLLLL